MKRDTEFGEWFVSLYWGLWALKPLRHHLATACLYLVDLISQKIDKMYTDVK